MRRIILVIFLIFTASAARSQFIKVTKIPVIDSLDLYIDYGIPVDKLISQCDFGYVDKDILEETFPFLVVPKQEKIKVYIWRFRTPVLSDSVVKYFAAAGMASASIRELLTLGYLFPKYQEKSPVVALCKAQNIQGGQFIVPMIEKDPESSGKQVPGKSGVTQRGLLLAEWNGYWRMGTAFVAVKNTLSIVPAGEIKYKAQGALIELLNCTAGKEFKKLEFEPPADKKGKTVKWFLVNSTAGIPYSEFLRKVKKLNSKLRPGNLYDLISAKDSLLVMDQAVMATGLLPGQQSNRYPMLTGPDCRLQVVEIGNDFRIGHEASFLFTVTMKK